MSRIEHPVTAAERYVRAHQHPNHVETTLQMLGLAGYDAVTTDGTRDRRRARIHRREASVRGRRS
jgi:hypothetical protein